MKARQWLKSRRLVRETWIVEECPSCGHQVAFLPAQLVNVCAWCQTVVRRGLE